MSCAHRPENNVRPAIGTVTGLFSAMHDAVVAAPADGRILLRWMHAVRGILKVGMECAICAHQKTLVFENATRGDVPFPIYLDRCNHPRVLLSI